MKIAYLPADFSGVGHLRCIYPMIYLRQLGVPCECYPEFHRDEKSVVYDIDRPPEADLYAIQASHELARLNHIRKLRDEGKKVVVDVDDDWIAPPRSNPAWINTHPNPVIKARARARVSRIPIEEWHKLVLNTHEVNRENLLAMLVEADALTVTTEALKTRYSRFNKRIHVIPNALHWSDWEDVRWEIKPEVFRIGYLGNLTFAADNVGVLKGALGPWMERHPHTRFVAIGDARVHDELHIPEAQRITELSETVDFPGHAPHLAKIDLGLAPLAETTFAECKSHLKGMEYNAAGVPYIASPTRAYRDFTREGMNGFLAKRASDWLRYIERLALDPLRAAEVGTWGRQYVEGAHTLRRSVHRWRAAYEEVLA